jgi:hypothetical protein
MPLGAIVGLSAFVAASLALGLRLLFLARRGGGLPEYALAVAFVFSGGIGAALEAVPPLGLGSPEFQAAAWTAVRASIDLGIGCQVLFTWRVFRPRSDLAGAAFFAFAAAAGTSSATRSPSSRREPTGASSRGALRCSWPSPATG